MFFLISCYCGGDWIIIFIHMISGGKHGKRAAKSTSIPFKQNFQGKYAKVLQTLIQQTYSKYFCYCFQEHQTYILLK